MPAPYRLIDSPGATFPADTTDAETSWPSDQNQFQVTRVPTTPGGDPFGYQPSALYVRSEPQPGVYRHEHAIKAELLNYATQNPGAIGPWNVAIYPNAIKYASASTWAFALEAQERSPQGSGGEIIGAEIAVRTNRTSDAGNGALGVHIVSKSVDGAGGFAGHALRINAGVDVSGFGPPGKWLVGIALGYPETGQPYDWIQTAIHNRAEGYRGYWDQGKSIVGIDLAGTYSEAALRIQANNKISLAANSQWWLRMNSTNQCLEFFNGTRRCAYINFTGSDHAL